jgi:hypothetical protein
MAMSRPQPAHPALSRQAALPKLHKAYAPAGPLLRAYFALNWDRDYRLKYRHQALQACARINAGPLTAVASNLTQNFTENELSNQRNEPLYYNNADHFQIFIKRLAIRAIRISRHCALVRSAASITRAAASPSPSQLPLRDQAKAAKLVGSGAGETVIGVGRRVAGAERRGQGQGKHGPDRGSGSGRPSSRGPGPPNCWPGPGQPAGCYTKLRARASVLPRSKWPPRCPSAPPLAAGTRSAARAPHSPRKGAEFRPKGGGVTRGLGLDAQPGDVREARTICREGERGEGGGALGNVSLPGPGPPLTCPAPHSQKAVTRDLCRAGRSAHRGPAAARMGSLAMVMSLPERPVGPSHSLSSQCRALCWAWIDSSGRAIGPMRRASTEDADIVLSAGRWDCSVVSDGGCAAWWAQ